MIDLGDIARERAWLRRRMTDQGRAEIALWRFTCRCLTPWVSHADRARLGLVDVSLCLCAVRRCPLCAGTGVAFRDAAGASDLRCQIVLSGRRSIDFPEHRPMRRFDPRFPRPEHTSQPGVTWDDARRDLAAMEAA